MHYPLRARQVMNFVGALERADWQVESWSARGTTEELPRTSGLARGHPGPDPQHPGAVQMGADGAPADVALDRGRVTLLGDACHSMLPFLRRAR